MDSLNVKIGSDSMKEMDEFKHLFITRKGGCTTSRGG